MEDENQNKQDENQNKEEETNQEKPEVVSFAEKAAENLRAENERMEKNIHQLREIQAFQTLGGRSEGRVEVEKKEETPQEYAQRILRNQQ